VEVNSKLQDGSEERIDSHTGAPVAVIPGVEDYPGQGCEHPVSVSEP